MMVEADNSKANPTLAVKPEGGPALFLVRSPLQVVLAERIIALEKIKRYDVVYYNRAVNRKDLIYFQRLAQGAEKSVHITAGHLLRLPRSLAIVARRHSAIYFATLSFTLFRTLLAFKNRSTYVSFDDGAANFIQQSFHRRESRGLARLRDKVFAAPSAGNLFAKVDRHYTLDKTLPNIVDASKLRNLTLLDEEPPNCSDNTGKKITFVIGQPYHEVLEDSQIRQLREGLAQIPSGNYLPHPREAQGTTPESLVRLEDERLAEEVITSALASGANVRVIGWYSTVLYTLKDPRIEKVFLHVSSDESLTSDMVRQGCIVHDLRTAEGRSLWHDYLACCRNSAA